MLEARKAQGLATPALDNRPEVYSDLAPVWGAFCVLSRSRQAGMSHSPIDIRAIFALLDEEGIDDASERREWRDLIQHLDSMWLRRTAARDAQDAHARTSHRRS